MVTRSTIFRFRFRKRDERFPVPNFERQNKNFSISFSEAGTGKLRFLVDTNHSFLGTGSPKDIFGLSVHWHNIIKAHGRVWLFQM